MASIVLSCAACGFLLSCCPFQYCARWLPALTGCGFRVKFCYHTLPGKVIRFPSVHHMGNYTARTTTGPFLYLLSPFISIAQLVRKFQSCGLLSCFKVFILLCSSRDRYLGVSVVHVLMWTLTVRFSDKENSDFLLRYRVGFGSLQYGLLSFNLDHSAN